jgi:uncharacterized membrane protein
MAQRKIAGVNAIIFFFFWLLILLAGADKPPPRDFLWVILAVALCAGVVYWRIPTYINWNRTQRPGRLWRVALDGVLAGLVVATPFALVGSGEPSITMQPVDYVIWFAVLAMMGAFNSMALFFVNGLVAGRLDVER